MLKKINKIACAFLLGLSLSLLSLASAQAKEGNFRPAIGDILSSSSGLERVLTTEDGGLSAFSGAGNLLPGFPVFAEALVFVSSPALIDVNADGTKEIAVMTRNASSVYSLYIYNGNGTLLSSGVLPGETIYFDPIVLRDVGINQEYVLLATESGGIFKSSISGSNITFSSVASPGQPVTLAPRQSGEGMFLTYPQSTSIDVYIKKNGALTLDKTISTDEAIVYPAVQDGSVLYGITDSQKLVAYSLNTSNIISGFPVNFSGTAVAEPVVAEVSESNSGSELVVQLSDGTRQVFDLSGVDLGVLEGAEGSFLDTELDSAEPDGGLFSGIFDFTTRVFTSAKDNVASIFSKIKHVLISVTASSNANLANLSVSGVSANIVPSFSSENLSYTLDLSFDENQVLFNVSPENVQATATIEGTTIVAGVDTPFAVAVGVTDFNIIVTAEDGTTVREYVVTVTRADDVTAGTHAWNFDENTGCTAGDQIGSSDGIFAPDCPTDSPEWSATALSGSATKFDGLNDYIDFGDVGSGSDGSLTLSTWFRLASDSAGRRVLFTYGAVNDWLYAEVNPGNQLVLYDDIDNANAGLGAYQLYPEKWYHLALVILPNGNKKMYVNGDLHATANGSGKTALDVDNENLNLGRRADGYYFFSGTVDETEMFDVVLDEAQVTSLYNEYSIAETPNAEYIFSFQEQTGCEVEDNGSSMTAYLKPNCNDSDVPLLNTSGVVSSGIIFDGINDYVDMGVVSPAGDGSFTISTWFNIDPSSSGRRVVWTYGSINDWLQLEVNPSNAIVLSDDIDNANTFVGGQVVTTGEWHNAVVVVAPNGTKSVYIDGLLSATQSGSGQNAAAIEQPILHLGHRYDGYYFFDGSIDEFGFYPNTWTATDAKDNYEALAPTQMQAAIDYMFHFDENAGCTVASDQPDLSGKLSPNCDGGDAPIWTSDSKLSSALHFDGQNDTVSLGQVQPSDTGEITLAGWFKFDTEDIESESRQTIFGYGTTNNWVLAEVFKDPSGPMVLKMFDDIDGGDYSTYVKVALTEDTWYHLALVVHADGSKDIYLNGQAHTESTSGSSNMNASQISASHLIVGGRFDGFYHFDGIIDEVNVLRRAATSAEIADIYNSF